MCAGGRCEGVAGQVLAGEGRLPEVWRGAPQGEPGQGGRGVKLEVRGQAWTGLDMGSLGEGKKPKYSLIKHSSQALCV